ncbi:MAG TPA: hypothetical protein VLF41_03790 [Candidatus Nanoarchaeia archaeon]|nr:hypothetical protein [Candidatus Nanoarchaeia archaeon]
MPGEAPQPSPESERPPEFGPVFEYPSETEANLEQQTDQTAEQAPASPAFLDNWPVAVLRSSGVVEHDWKVSATLDNGNVRVTKEEGKHLIDKELPPGVLAAMQPHFVVGQSVEVPRVHLEDQRVVRQNPNGSVIIAGTSGSGEQRIVRVSAVELFGILNPPHLPQGPKKRWFRRAS